MEEALQQQKKATELDPFGKPWALGFALLRARQFDAALNKARVKSDAHPNNADLHYLLSYVCFFKGMEREAEEESERQWRVLLGQPNIFTGELEKGCLGQYCANISMGVATELVAR